MPLWNSNRWAPSSFSTLPSGTGSPLRPPGVRHHLLWIGVPEESRDNRLNPWPSGFQSLRGHRWTSDEGKISPALGTPPPPTLRGGTESQHGGRRRESQAWVGTLVPRTGLSPFARATLGTQGLQQQLIKRHGRQGKRESHTTTFSAVSQTSLKTPRDNKRIWRQKLGQDRSQRNHFYLQVKRVAKGNPYYNCKREKKSPIKLTFRFASGAGADRGAVCPTCFPANGTESGNSTTPNKVSLGGLRNTGGSNAKLEQLSLFP